MQVTMDMQTLEHKLNIVNLMLDEGNVKDAHLIVKGLVVAAEIHNNGLEHTYNQALKG